MLGVGVVGNVLGRGRKQKVRQKSPAVSRASRLYCLCPMASKCKRSFLSISIASDIAHFRHLHQLLPLQILAKPLQITTWLPLTVYRNLPTPYSTILSLIRTTHHLATIRKVTDNKQTDERRTTRRTMSVNISLVQSVKHHKISHQNPCTMHGF